MTVQFTDPATALAHIEAYLNGGDELGDVPEADAVAALAYLRQVLAPQPVTAPATVAEAEAGLSFEKPGYGELSNLYSAVMSDFLDLKLKCAGSMKEAHSLRQELAASQEQYRGAMGNLIARKLDLAEARREAADIRRQLEVANARIKSLETSLTELALLVDT
jgi:hypothetical protein